MAINTFDSYIYRHCDSAMFVYSCRLLSFSVEKGTKFSAENCGRFCTKAKIHVGM